VYSANQEAARKRLAAGRNRLRQGGGMSGPGTAKRASGGWPSGSWIVDFMYAQLGGVSGAPGANAAADWDDTAQAQSAAEGERDRDRLSGTTASAAGAQSQLSAGPVSSGSLFGAALNSLLLGSLGRNAHASQSATAAATATSAGTKAAANTVSKGKRAKDASSPAAGPAGQGSSELAKAVTGASKAAAGPSLFGELFSLVIPASSAAHSTTEANRPGDPSSAPSGKRKDSPRTDMPNEFSARPAIQVPAANSAAPNGVPSGRSRKKVKDPSHSAGFTSTVSGSGKSHTNPAAQQQESVRRSRPSSDSLNSASSTGSSSSDADGAKSRAASSFNPPVVLNNRRVSWAGLLPQTTTAEGGAAQDGSEGDWAEASKKRGRNKHANSGPAEENSGTAASAAPRTERIALSLKESPLFRHPPARSAAAPRPSSQQAATAARPSSAAPTASAVSASTGAVRSPFEGNVRQTQQSAGTPPVGQRGSANWSPVSGTGPGSAYHPDSAAHATAPSAAASRGRALDLSEAKLLAEQLGGWTVSGSASSSSNGSPLSLGPSPTAPAGLPPGLRRVGQTSASDPAAASLASFKPPLTPTGGGTGAFGFSQFDVGKRSTGGDSSPSLWASAAAPALPDTAHSGFGGTHEGSGLLGSLLPYSEPAQRRSLLLNTSSAASTVHPATTSTTSTGEFGAYYGAADGIGFEQDAYGAYYADQGEGAGGYYYGEGQGLGQGDEQLYYGQYGEGKYDLYGLGAGQEIYAGYSGAEPEVQHSVWGGRNGAIQITSHDLTGSSITSEASAVYGLSPDAPSFRPSQPQRTRATEQTALTGSLAPLQPPALGLDLGFAELLLTASSGSGATYPPLQAQQSPGSALDVSDDFFQSYLIDSILGGEDQVRPAALDDE
jgi:hypothetical protein